MKKGEISRQILKILLIGGAFYLTLSSPIGTRKFLKQLPKELHKYKQSQLRNALYRLRCQSKVDYIRDESDNTVVEITKDGKKYLEKMDIDNLSLQKPQRWDRKWRLVIFDIPEKKKLAREALRNKLKELGFKKLQHSIWATPFPCEKEMNFLKIVFNLSNFWLDVIITENMGAREYEFRKHFDLI